MFLQSEGSSVKQTNKAIGCLIGLTSSCSQATLERADRPTPASRHPRLSGEASGEKP